MGEENKDKQKLARVVVTFIKNFKKTKQLDLDEIQDILKRFLDEFIGVEEVQQFRKLMTKEWGEAVLRLMFKFCWIFRHCSEVDIIF